MIVRLKCEKEGDEFWVSDFRHLEIDSRAWEGLEETVAYSTASYHVGAVGSFLSSFLLVV